MGSVFFYVDFEDVVIDVNVNVLGEGYFYVRVVWVVGDGCIVGLYYIVCFFL